MSQLELPLKVVVAKDINGLEMGVLSDGTSYLTGRSLARLCGVAQNAVSEHTKSWDAGERTSKLARFLIKSGFNRASLYVSTMRDGVRVNAHPDDVCALMLEYYAFESRAESATAEGNYRLVARAGIREFIYRAVGHDPKNAVPPQWRAYHDRVLMNRTPPGYFSVFREMSELMVTAMQHDLVLDSHTVPDVSVGLVWGKYWEDEALGVEYGDRFKFPHEYPPYMPQANANGTIEAWVYPVEALGAFRIWMHDAYLPEKFPAYLKAKVKQNKLPPSSAELILAALVPHELDPAETEG